MFNIFTTVIYLFIPKYMFVVQIKLGELASSPVRVYLFWVLQLN